MEEISTKKPRKSCKTIIILAVSTKMGFVLPVDILPKVLFKNDEYSAGEWSYDRSNWNGASFANTNKITIENLLIAKS